MLPVLVEVIVLRLLLSMTSGRAVPLSSFYSYGSAVNDTLLPPNDDESSPAIILPAPLPFFGTYHNTAYVSQLNFCVCMCKCYLLRSTFEKIFLFHSAQ